MSVPTNEELDMVEVGVRYVNAPMDVFESQMQSHFPKADIETLIALRDTMLVFYQQYDQRVSIKYAYYMWSIKQAQNAPEMPSAFDMAKGFVKEMTTFATTGWKLTEEPERTNRWELCQACEKLTESNRCSLCGCFMKAKVTLASAKCPDGKW